MTPEIIIFLYQEGIKICLYIFPLFILNRDVKVICFFEGKGEEKLEK